jgi:hypothetical protein
VEEGSLGIAHGYLFIYLYIIFFCCNKILLFIAIFVYLNLKFLDKSPFFYSYNTSSMEYFYLIMDYKFYTFLVAYFTVQVAVTTTIMCRFCLL